MRLMTFNALTSARSHSLSWQYFEFSDYLQTALAIIHGGHGWPC